MSKKRKFGEKEEEQFTTKLVDLNTECLIEICNYLNCKDLFNLKKTHWKFGDAIDYVVSTSISDQMLFTINAESGDFQNDLSFVKKCLKTFGDRMKYLAIDLAHFNKTNENARAMCQNDVEKAVQDYCSVAGNNIRYAVFHNFRLRTTTFLNTNKSLFEGLDSLTWITDTDYINEEKELLDLLEFVTTSKLKEIIIIPFYLHQMRLNVNIFPKIAASQLERCIIALGKSKRYFDKIELPINKTLKYLDLDECVYDLEILENFPNIEHLSYWYKKSPLEPILRLTKLRELELGGRLIMRVLPFLSKLADANQIESFSYIADATKDEINIFSKMTNLIELKICVTTENIHCLPQLAENLKKLRKITFFLSGNNDDHFCNDLHQMILKFVKMAKCLVVLTLSMFLHEQIKFDYQKLYDDLVIISKTRLSKEELLLQLFYCQAVIISSDEQRKYVRCQSKDTNQN